MTGRAREICKAALASALVLLSLHGVSVALLGSAWQELAPAARQAFAGIAPHLVAFHAGLAFSVAAIGASFGALGWIVLRVLHVRTTTARSAALALAGCAAVAVRAVARKPALFESFLWRKGGVRAAAQVLIVERIGARAWDALLIALLLAAAGGILWQNRGRWRDRRALAGAAIGAAVLGLGAMPRGCATRVAGRPIIVLAADSLRPDHFSSEGYPRATTPEIDRLRARAGWVEHDFVPISSTTSSWASLLTGTYPHTHGIRHLFPRAEQTRVRVPALPRLLAERGYSTAVVSDYAGESFSRVDLGFQTVDAPPATSLEVIAEREAFQRLPLPLAFFSGRFAQRLFPVAQYLPVNADPADLTERAFAQLDRLERAGKPFFLIVFYSVTHAPFAPPMPDAAAFSDPAYSGASRYSYEIQQLSDIARASAPVSEAEARQVRALYDGALRAFDREVGRFLARLDHDGLRDRVLVVTGDHGENLFEPGTTTEHGKWFEGGEAANRTALLIEAPGVKPGRLAGLASGIDFAPTLLALAGVDPPATMEGRSLLLPEDPDRIVFAETAIWLGGPADAPPGALAYPGIVDLLAVEEETHALVLKERYEGAVVGAKLRAARQGRWEATYMPTSGAPRWKLFDLEKDPYAQHDLSAEDPEKMGALKSSIRAWLSRDRLHWLDVNDRVVARYER